MVIEKITDTLEILQTAGIQATRGYPGSKITGVIKPVATVSLEQYTDCHLTLAVDIFGPTDWGGSTYEELALNIAGKLTGKMAICTVGKCEFSGKTGLFALRILARWYRKLAYAVNIDNEPIPYVTACRAEKNVVRAPYVDSATGDVLTTVERNEWSVTVTDIWPLNQKLPAERTDAFTLFLMRPGSLEAYEQCVWARIGLEETPAGVLRTRVAKTYRDPMPGAG